VSPDLIFLTINDISYYESNGSRTRIHLLDEQVYLGNGNLGEFAKVLEQHHFVRIHH